MVRVMHDSMRLHAACALLASLALAASTAHAQPICAPGAPQQAIDRGLCRPAGDTPTPRTPATPPPTAADFCSLRENQLRTAPAPAHARTRFARVALDRSCSRHPAIRCTSSSPVRREAHSPTACVDIEVVQGAAARPYDGPGAYPLECAQCPEDTLPTGGIALCGPETLAEAQRGRMLFNIAGTSVDHMQQIWDRAMAARQLVVARARAASPRPTDAELRTLLDRSSADWGTDLTAIVQELAPQLGYCESAPVGMAPENRGWRYADRWHRVDLSSDVFFRGEGDFGSTTMGTTNAAFGTGPDHGGLVLYLTAFYAALPRGGLAGTPTFDLDGLVLGLVHEMRHMGMPGFGLGVADDPVVANAERFLNELQDYTRMFEHPYLIGLPAARLEALRSAYGVGRNVMYGCFANVWGDTGPSGFPGYPDDSQQAVGMALGLMMGGGFGGLVMPLIGLPLPGRAPPPRTVVAARRGRRGRATPPPAPAQPTGPRPVWPQLLDASNWNPQGFRADSCTSSGLTVSRAGALPRLSSPAQRCQVARWASEDVWMRSKMVRSIAPGEEHQPWNTLGHWVLALPLRAPAYGGCQ